MTATYKDKSNDASFGLGTILSAAFNKVYAHPFCIRTLFTHMFSDDDGNWNTQDGDHIGKAGAALREQLPWLNEIRPLKPEGTPEERIRQIENWLDTLAEFYGYTHPVRKIATDDATPPAQTARNNARSRSRGISL